MNHRPRKRFGQHFLCDPNIIEKIVGYIAPNKTQAMVEIGPGLGAITCPLLERVGCLDVVELDRDLIPHLLSLCVNRGKLVIHNEDALRFNFTRLAPENGGLRIIGNLPYNISTPLLFHLLKFSSFIVDMHFLLQKEVVERITAVPGTGNYGRLSVMVQSLARAERLFNVGSGCFSPPPKVNSAFIRLSPHRKPVFSINDRRQFSRVVTQAFSKRRKTLRNALKGLLSADEISAENIDPGARAETLSIEQFAALSNRLNP
ncbi:MAG: 16S rRNA (adenine(1518)-N(6)/adenine(1519)-N(6))-dimethyltransferase RsmA [Pseudomonadota bacterium]